MTPQQVQLKAIELMTNAAATQLPVENETYQHAPTLQHDQLAGLLDGLHYGLVDAGIESGICVPDDDGPELAGYIEPYQLTPDGVAALLPQVAELAKHLPDLEYSAEFSLYYGGDGQPTLDEALAHANQIEAAVGDSDDAGMGMGARDVQFIRPTFAEAAAVHQQLAELLTNTPKAHYRLSFDVSSLPEAYEV